jgi:uncharacterized protein YggE
VPADFEGPVITVVGAAAIRTPPDEATISLTLSAVDPSPADAFSDVVRRSDALVSLLDELGVAPADRVTTGVQLHEEHDHTHGGRVSLGHRATAVLAVRLADNELVGRLVTRAVTELGAAVSGPVWSVSASNPARLEAARQAAADARRRAQAYAEGIDATLGPVLSLSEADETHPRPRRGRMIAVAASSAGIPIEPGEQEVTASIEATFALNPAG